MSSPKLLVVAAQEMWISLERGLTPLEADILYTPRLAHGPAPLDPFGLRAEISARPDQLNGVLLVAPRRNAPSRLVPSLLIDGVPIAIVQADRTEQLNPWLHALYTTQGGQAESIWACMAMGKNAYIAWGKLFFSWMQEGANSRDVLVQNWMADRVSREEVCQNLAIGARLVVYCGHARARGWSGYQALRWEHITNVEQKNPCGILITIGCRTLCRTRGAVPFGCLWINAGRAAAYLAPASSLTIKPAEQIARVLGEQLAAAKCETIGQLLVSTERVLRSAPQMAQAYRQFLTFRLLGNPFQHLY